MSADLNAKHGELRAEITITRAATGKQEHYVLTKPVTIAQAQKLGLAKSQEKENVGDSLDCGA